VSVTVREYKIRPRDFIHAGEGSIEIKKILKSGRLDADTIRRVSVCAYEAEMNVVIHGGEGILSITLDDTGIVLEVQDDGPGIDDINLAMKEGYSTAGEETRAMGFGAGMGLPNIVKHSDCFEIFTEKGKGVFLRVFFKIKNN